jgi:hypothetical protein
MPQFHIFVKNLKRNTMDKLNDKISNEAQNTSIGAETKKEIKKLRLELLKRIWYLFGIVLFILITGATFVNYYWTGEQPSNFTMLVIIWMAIILNGKRN